MLEASKPVFGVRNLNGSFPWRSRVRILRLLLLLLLLLFTAIEFSLGGSSPYTS